MQFWLNSTVPLKSWNRQIKDNKGRFLERIQRLMLSMAMVPKVSMAGLSSQFSTRRDPVPLAPAGFETTK